jgi:hypothetical protein
VATVSDSLGSSWGDLKLPLTTLSDTDFSDLDPARDILLALLTAAITSELSPVWDLGSTGSGLIAPVGTSMPALDDLEAMRQAAVKFPVLSVSRSVEPQQEDEFTLWQDRITSRWVIDYVLAPFAIGHKIKMADTLTAVARIIAATIRNGGHKAYAKTTVYTPTSGTPLVSAKQVLGPVVGGCGFSTVAITSFTQGAAAFSQTGAKYHALTMTLTTTELDSFEPATVAFTGTKVTLDAGPVISIDTAIAL